MISLNASMQQAFANAGDVRANYVMIGSLWTSEGNVPGGTNEVKLAGGVQTANSTMETYTQNTTSKPGNGCFDCHTYFAGANDGNISVSHIFDHMYPVSDPLPQSLRDKFVPVRATTGPNTCAN